MEWDSISPRACKPPPMLANGTVPTVGTADHALNSPLPYGLGIYALDSTGEKRRPLPLYYVPQKAADVRAARYVQAGWYAVAEAGVEFELVLTAIRPDFPKMGGIKLKKGQCVQANVYVDGSYVVSWTFAENGCEEVISGFVETGEYGADGDVKETVRRFKFKKAETTEDHDADENSNVGSILVEMISGRTGKRMKSYPVGQSKNLEESTQRIHEKEAVKKGKSIKVGLGETHVTSTPLSELKVGKMVQRKPVGSFEIFVREKFWMMSRRIIDKDGNLWAPTLEVAGGSVDAQPETNQPETKKVECEIVDLTEPELGTKTMKSENVDLAEPEPETKKIKREHVSLTETVIIDLID